MEVEFKDVLERDVDFLLMDSFCNTPDFVSVFTKRIGHLEAKVLRVCHSMTDVELGENDVCVWIEDYGKRYALLIEDKIDAQAQPEQYERYELRASRMKEEEQLDDCYIFMVAPKVYLETNSMAKKYPNQISYEELLKFFTGKNVFKESLLRRAITKKESGYIPLEDKAVTDFWQKYYAYRREYYSELMLSEIDGPRGAKALWATYKTQNPSGKLDIWHKADRGFVDLQLPKLGGHEEDVKELLKDRLIGIDVVNASKSVALRITVPVLDFRKPFEDYSEQMPEIFDAICTLSDIAKDLYYTDICSKVEEISGDKIL